MTPGQRLAVVWAALGVGIWLMLTAAFAVNPRFSLPVSALFAGLAVVGGAVLTALIVAGLKWAAPRSGE